MNFFLCVILGALALFIGNLALVIPHFTTGVYDPILSETDDYLCGNRTGVNPYCEKDHVEYVGVFICFKLYSSLTVKLEKPVHQRLFPVADPSCGRGRAET